MSVEQAGLQEGLSWLRLARGLSCGSVRQWLGQCRSGATGDWQSISLSFYMYLVSASLPHCTVASGQLNDWRPKGCAFQLQEWGFQPRKQILCHLLWLNLGRLEELHLLHGVGYKWGTNLPRYKRRGIKLHLLVGEQQGSRKHMRWEIRLWSCLRNAICCLRFIGRILGPRVYRNAVKWFFVCFCFFFSVLFVWVLSCSVCGILFPQSRIEPATQQRSHRVLTSGLPGSPLL